MGITGKLIKPVRYLVRRSGVTAKMITLTLLIGLLVWTVLDNMYTKSLKVISGASIDRMLEGKNPKAEIELMNSTILRSERQQRAILAFSLILCFSLLVFTITRRIRRLKADITAFSENMLKVKIGEGQRGDELLMLEAEFQHLTVAIIEARDLLKQQSDILLSEKTVYLNSIMNSSPFAIAATDLNFVVKYYNPVAEKVFGYKAGDVVGRTVPHILEMLKKDPSIFEKAMEAVRRENLYSYNIKTTVEGETRFLESRVSGIWDDSRKLIGFVLMSVDVTDRLKAYEEVKSMAKFPDENPYPVMRMSPDGVLMYSNNASSPLLDLWGCRPSETVPEHLKELLKDIFEAGTNREIEVAVGDRVMSTIFVPVAEEGYLNVYSRDISERKHIEELLRNYTRELERSNKDLELFASIASHDLQEPLRGVSGFAGLLRRRYAGKLDRDADEFIGFIMDGAERMQQLIRDLLDYSRVTTKGKPFAPVDCNDTVKAAVNNLKTAIDESSAVVDCGPLPVLEADRGQIIRLFQNLIGNAIKYSGDRKPAIRISAEHKAGEWVFSVSDNGIGIDEQYYDRIFQIFQRLHKRNEYSGTGIGLAICKRIIDRHGGRIWVESEPGKGSVFNFTLQAG